MSDELLISLFSITILVLLIFYYFQENNDDHPIILEVKRRFRKINEKFGNIPIRKGDESYTEDKRSITLCIYDYENQKYYDINSIMYVALHELSHMITKASGAHSHGEEFIENFSKLKKRAESLKLYDSSKPMPDIYCGVK